MVIVSLLAILLAVFVIFYFAKRIAAPIEAIRDECNILNSGDLRKNDLTIDSHDEFGQLAQGFNTMRQTLRTLLKKVQSQTEQVAASSQELTASAHQSSEAANQVAISITDIAAGVETQSSSSKKIRGISENISTNTDALTQKTQKIADNAKTTTLQAETGRNSIAKVVEQMQQITLGTKTIETAIEDLAKGS